MQRKPHGAVPVNRTIPITEQAAGISNTCLYPNWIKAGQFVEKVCIQTVEKPSDTRTVNPGLSTSVLSHSKLAIDAQLFSICAKEDEGLLGLLKVIRASQGRRQSIWEKRQADMLILSGTLVYHSKSAIDSDRLNANGMFVHLPQSQTKRQRSTRKTAF